MFLTDQVPRILTPTADEISSVAVESQLFLTLLDILLKISFVIPSLIQAHEARACGPGGHK